ncbi:U-box domain-containing protein 35-like [Nymphaea colorata]|nr:U-box domain-containing protein 35-like [Nymphaea colorata]
MSQPRKGDGGSVAVAVDRDKGSQYAVRWAVEHLLTKGQTLNVVHVKPKSQTGSNPNGSEDSAQMEEQIKELILPFRCYCTRKDINCKDVILEDNDVTKAIIEYVSQATIENLVVGASSRSSFLRFKSQDIASSISKGAPEYCTVYTISKGKITSVRSATRAAPVTMMSSRPPTNIQPSTRVEPVEPSFQPSLKAESDGMDTIKSPFNRPGRGSGARNSIELNMHETDISFVNPSSRQNIERPFPSRDYSESGRPPRLSFGQSMDEDILASGNNRSFQSPLHYTQKSMDLHSNEMEHSSTSFGSGGSWSSQTGEDLEAEMRRLKLELKQTMDMYSNACKEALSAKQKAIELHRWKVEEEQRLEEARLAEEAALALAEKEKQKCKAAMEAAEAAQRIAEIEAQKRISAEMKALKEAEEKKKALDALAQNDVRYRKYTIQEIEIATDFFSEKRKIGEGGYGPVYSSYLDHTPVAIKVLRPDAAQGRMQFQQEVEVLSCIRHPNMVLLLGACPEYGCLVYEYMANGSLDDCLFRRGNTPLSWQLRFRIAAEIATGLLFLHQTKPEPLVHRDLKPANILLDRNFVAKISDVGLARLVPPNVVNDVTQYRMTSTAGTFCYIDPEYQQTGMLGIKSDIYSLGIMLLQIITAKPPMGLTHHVERAIDKGTLKEFLDPAVTDWPMQETMLFAKLALKCAELRRKDRPDLGTEVLPQLEKLRVLGEENMSLPYMLGGSTNASPNHSLAMMRQEVISESISSGFTNESSIKSLSSTSTSMIGRRAL